MMKRLNCTDDTVSAADVIYINSKTSGNIHALTGVGVTISGTAADVAGHFSASKLELRTMKCKISVHCG